MAYYVSKTMASIVSEALLLLNKVEGQDEPDNVDMQRGAKALQMMLESWQTQGVSFWMRRRDELFTADGMADYDLSVDPGVNAIELLHCSLCDEDDEEESEQTVNIISRQDYLDMPNKLTEGRPTQVWFSFDENDLATITFWPVPDDSYKIKIDYRLRFTNTNTTTTVIDIPRHWLRATIWSLADELQVSYGLSGTAKGQMVSFKAREFFDTAAAFDNIQDGGGEIRFQPGP